MHLFVEKIVHLFVGFPISKVKLTFDSKNYHNSKYHIHSLTCLFYSKKQKKKHPGLKEESTPGVKVSRPKKIRKNFQTYVRYETRMSMKEMLYRMDAGDTFSSRRLVKKIKRDYLSFVY